MDISQQILALKKSILEKDYGKEAESIMFPSGIPYLASSAEPIHSSVLCLLFPRNNELTVLLMQRNDYDGPHSGQVCFPGGKKEPTDRDHLHTALREAQEETGAQLEEAQILGQLSDVFIRVSNFLVHVFVGYLPFEPSFNIDSSEVQALITLPSIDLSKLPLEETTMGYKGKEFTVNGFRYEKYYIWGATGKMLCELKLHFRSLLEENPNFWG